MRGQPRPTIFFENLQHFFAITEGVEQRSDGADIQRVGSQPQHMAGQTIQLGEDYPDVARPRWRLHVEQFLNRLAIP